MPLQRVVSKTLQQNLATKWPHQSVLKHTYVHTNVLMNMYIRVKSFLIDFMYICAHVRVYIRMNMSKYVCVCMYVFIDLIDQSVSVFVKARSILSFYPFYVHMYVCTYKCECSYTDPWPYIIKYKFKI